MDDCHSGFTGTAWRERIDVRDFILNNYEPYEGDGSFLVGPTRRTRALREKCLALLAEERRRGGVYAVDAETIAGITSHPPGYIDRDLEIIVGLQTDEPLKFGPVWDAFTKTLGWLTGKYVDTMNVIHYMHDKYTADMLPYNRMGVVKWKQLGLDCALEGVPEPTPDDLARARRVFHEYSVPLRTD